MTLVADRNDVDAVVSAIGALGDPSEFQAPSGYPDSLALCILDSIWSIGVRYGAVKNVVTRYREWVGSRGGDADRRAARELIVDIADGGGPERFATDVVVNEQRTSPKSGVLKAEAVLQAARKLTALGIDDATDLRERTGDDAIKRAWLSVRGQSSGVSWYYLNILALVEDVKPDRMITRFLAGALGRPVDPAEARSLVRAAHQTIEASHPGLTLRALDHAVWRNQSAAARA